MRRPKMASNFNPVDIKPDVRKTVKGFGSFKVALADVLTVTIVLQLATFFEYPPVIIEELGTAAGAGLLMIRYMEERGQIQPKSILTLLSALQKICLSGTGDRVKKLYEEHTGRLCSSDGQSKAQEEGKLKIFTNSLKHTYALWYNRIHPNPYVRYKECCIDDIYVESGLELVHQPLSFKHDSQSFEESGSVSLKSFRDIFDSDKISSNRILLEGDPGYGKSTLTLQAAYDWCVGNVASPLKNVAVFILLPLRLLGNISLIFEAIRFVLMPAESPLTDGDILEILRHSISVVIVLDGYDEYPEKNSVIETDIMKMIAGKMFPNVKVVVSTRSSSLPKYVDPTTVTIRMTGFDEKSRDEYIQRVVTGGDQQASRRITNALNSSPILNDICQVPMFCVLFAHVANDQKGVIEFSSMTSFFKYVIDCFYSHMWKKDQKEPIHQTIREYSKLNRLAFDGLTGKTQMAWPKHIFIDTVGKDCYEELSYIGILIVEKTNEIINEPEEYDIHHIKQNELVRFYHKLFAEWYAARYLSSYAGSFWPFLLERKLKKINPVDLQFVFRFACGLNKKSSGRIVKYLKSVKGGASVASLCLFEQPDDPEEVVETVKGLCSDGMIIRSSDSTLLQRSNIQLLEIASRKKIEVPCLQIDQSFKLARQNGITLESGLRLPVLLSLRKLVFTTQTEQEITQENMIGVVKYGQRCLHLRILALHGKFVLPLSVNIETLKSSMNSRNITVFWQLLEHVFQLDVSSGKWRLTSMESLTSGIVEPGEDVEMLRRVCYGGMALRRTDSRLLQRASIQFLEIASRHKIPLSCLVLDTFREADKHSITLENGNHVPVLSTLEEMQIRTEKSVEFTQEQVVGLLCYAQLCPKLQKISFIDCLVPLWFPNVSLWPCKSDTLRVLWKPGEQEFDLKFTRGRWTLGSQENLTLETKDRNSLRSLCSSTVYLDQTDSKQLQMSTILLLEIASNHNIPISDLYLRLSFSGFDGKDIRLESGLCLSSLSSVEKISINAGIQKKHMTEEEMIGLMNYGINSPRFKALWFEKCKLPSSIKPDIVPEEIRSRNIKVISSGEAHFLDLKSGKWRKPEDIQTITEMCSGGLIINIDTSESVQRSIIELLVKASNHDIPIYLVTLSLSFRKIDEDGNIILSSGLSLPILTSIERMSIYTERGSEMNKHEINGILNYVQHSQRFKTLGLYNCMLPSSIPVGPALSTLKSRGANVLWVPVSHKSDEDYILHLGSGLWLQGSTKYVDEEDSFHEETETSATSVLQDQCTTASLGVKQTISTNGGQMEIANTDVSLEIPPSALEKKQLIEVRIIPRICQKKGAVPVTSNSSLVVELLPNNIKLLQPAKLILPHCLVLKNDCEWKATVYTCNHKEDTQPLWEEDIHTVSELKKNNCVIWLQHFSWKKFEVGDEIVEARILQLYAARRPSFPDADVYIDVGYYWDRPDCQQIITLHTHRTSFYKNGQFPLTILFVELSSSMWTCDQEEENPKEITFNRVLTSDQDYRTFILKRQDTSETSGCSCYFKVGQGSDLVDLKFSLQVPGKSSLLTIDKPVTEQTAGIGHSIDSTLTLDSVVTETLLQLLSKEIIDWKTIGQNLQLRDAELQAIGVDNNKHEDAVFQTLLKWKRANGKDATCMVLGEALKDSGRKDLRDTFLPPM